MSHDKQFTLYSHKTAPNGWKVAMVLEELGLTYESIYLSFRNDEHKAPAFTKYNPNGRIPAIVDHQNNDFVLWESNAIIQYLVDKYDPEHKISSAGADDRYKQLQWLYFQASGQGPYFGQAGWFIRNHPEKVQSAIDRYKNEVTRVFNVLESVLCKQDWLVGGRPTVADISFVPWNDTAIMHFMDYNVAERFPATAAWHKRLHERPAIKRTLEIKASLKA